MSEAASRDATVNPHEPSQSAVAAILSDAQKISGMDSTFVVHGAAQPIVACVNGGPLKLAPGLSIAWLEGIARELQEAGAWQTHALDAERTGGSVGASLRVKTLFVLPIQDVCVPPVGLLCGLSQMRVVMDGAQLQAMNGLAALLSRLLGEDPGERLADAGRSYPYPGAKGDGRKGWRAASAQVTGGRDAASRRRARS